MDTAVYYLGLFLFLYILFFGCFYVLVGIVNLKTLRTFEKIFKKFQNKKFEWLSPFLVIIKERIDFKHRKTFESLNIYEIYESAQNIAGDTSSEDGAEEV